MFGKGTKFPSFTSKAGQSDFFSTSRASWLTVQDFLLCPSLLLMTKCRPGLIKLATLRHPRCGHHCLKASCSFLFSSQLAGCRSASFSNKRHRMTLSYVNLLKMIQIFKMYRREFRVEISAVHAALQG